MAFPRATLGLIRERVAKYTVTLNAESVDLSKFANLTIAYHTREVSSSSFPVNPIASALLVGVRHLPIDRLLVRDAGDLTVVMPLSSVEAAVAQHSRIGEFPSRIAQHLKILSDANKQSLRISTMMLVEKGTNTYAIDIGSYLYGVDSTEKEKQGSVSAVVVPNVFFEALKKTMQASVAGLADFHNALLEMVTSATFAALDGEKSLTQRLE